MLINSNNIYDSVNISLTEEYIKKVVISFITMTINCDKYVPNFPEHFEPYKVFYYFLKDEPNKSISIYDDIIKLNYSIQQTSIRNKTYNPIMKDGVSFTPIESNQLGWYSYQSWHLSNDKKYNHGDISHRFYINADSSVILDLIKLLKEKFEKMDIPYYFKVSDVSVIGNNQKDSIVIYSSTEELNNTLLVLQEIENLYPNIREKCGEPHLFCGNINGWIGYASEIKNQKNSYTNLMSKIMFESLETCVLNWIKTHAYYTVGDEKIPISQYFNKSIMKSGLKKDYITYIKKLGYLIEIIPKYDSDFKPELYRTIRENLEKNNFNPENICFNYDVLDELSKYKNKQWS